MQTRQVGNSDLDLSVIGLGTWAIGGPWAMGWGAQSDKDSIECIHQALDLGINWIDTAPIYGLGYSESLIGKALKEKGKGKVIIASKCGLRWNKKGSVKTNLNCGSVCEEVEASLRRLQVEAIDLMQIHWPKPEEEIEEGFETLLKLKNQGKIKHIAVCNFSAEQLERISAIAMPTSLQSPYNIFERKVEQDSLPSCLENKIGFLAYSPMECGILTSKFSRKWVQGLASDDWRSSYWGKFREIDYFEEEVLSRLLETHENLSRIAADLGLSVSQLAINWVIQQKGVTAAIVGARNAKQILETAKVVEENFSADVLAKVEQEIAEFQSYE